MHGKMRRVVLHIGTKVGGSRDARNNDVYGTTVLHGTHTMTYPLCEQHRLRCGRSNLYNHG